jgi:hypothetical protein
MYVSGIDGMKWKLFVVIILLLLINGKIYSSDFVFSNYVLEHRHGVMNSESEFSYYFTADLINYSIMNTNFGLNISPLHYSYIHEPKFQQLSFINLKLYYNFLKEKYHFSKEEEDHFYSLYGKNIIGPFFSVNWMNLNNFNEFDLRNITYSAGILFSFRAFGGHSSYNEKNIIKSPTTFHWFTLEMGYKNINGKNNMFIGVQILDPVFILALPTAFLFYLFTGIDQ